MSRDDTDAAQEAGAWRDSKAPAKSNRAQDDTRGSEQFREWRSGWGHLPQRDRDEIIQGVGERSLDKFRRWIERYYKALSDADEQ